MWESSDERAVEWRLSTQAQEKWRYSVSFVAGSQTAKLRSVFSFRKERSKVI